MTCGLVGNLCVWSTTGVVDYRRSRCRCFIPCIDTASVLTLPGGLMLAQPPEIAARNLLQPVLLSQVAPVSDTTATQILGNTMLCAPEKQIFSSMSWWLSTTTPISHHLA